MRRRKLFILTLSLLLSAIGAQAQTVKADFTAQEAIDLYYQNGFQTQDDFATWSLDTTLSSRAWYQTSGPTFGYTTTNPGAVISRAGDKNGVSNEWIISPAINVKAGSKVAFYTKFPTTALQNWNVFFKVILDNDTTTLLNFREWASNEANAYASNQWVQMVIDAADYAGKSVNFAFQYITESTDNTGAQAYIDAFTVGQYQQADTKANIAARDAVHFLNTSTGDNLTYEWTFASGEPATSTDKEPVVTYATRGDFDVTLTVKSGDATDTKTFKEFVHVGYKAPTAAIKLPENAYVVCNTQNPFIAAGSHEVTFKDASTDDPTYWAWDLGTGETITTQDATVNYNVDKSTSSSKQYKMALTAGNPAGETTVSTSSAIKVGGTQYIWNSKVLPSVTNVYRQPLDETTSDEFVGGYNTRKITRWAERFDAPMDTATITGFRLVIPGSTVTVNVPYAIQLEDENGMPGTVIWEGTIDKTTANTNGTGGVRTKYTTTTTGSASNKTTKYDLPLITKPFFVTFGEFPAGRGFAAYEQENAEDNRVYYVDSTQVWKEWEGAPYSLLIYPYVSYASTNVNQAISNAQPTAKIALSGVDGDVAVIEEGQSVRFDGTKSSASYRGYGSVQYHWEFPGGQPATSTLPTPSVKYEKEGAYDVKLTVTNEYGFADSVSIKGAVEVTEPTLAAAFTAKEAQEVVFSDDFEDSELPQWTATGDATVNGWKTIFSYYDYDQINPASKNRLFCQGAKDKLAQQTILSEEIDVKENTFADFYTYADLDGIYNATFFVKVGDEVTTLLDLATVADQQWEKQTVDLFPAWGKKAQIGFTFNGTGSTGSMSIEDLAVYVANNDTIKANVALDDSVQFINNSTGRNLKYEWTFEGGQPATSTDREPVVTYTTLGDHNVTLVVTDTVAQKSETKQLEGFVHVGYKQPLASIGTPKEGHTVTSSVQPFLATGKHQVTFFDLSQNHPTAWKWTFSTGGEVFATSTEQNPTIEYDIEKFASNTAKTITATLVASNEAGSDSVGISNINVGGAKYIWNSKFVPGVTNVYAYYTDDTKTSYIGGSNDLGITRWAERFEAPQDTATIDYIRVFFPTAANSGKGLTLTIQEEDENGLPGLELYTYSITSTKKATTRTKNYDTVTIPAKEQAPITKPFFVVVSGFSTIADKNVSLASVPQENEEDNTVYAYVDSLQQWKEWDGAPAILMITPELTYNTSKVDQAVKNFTPSVTLAAADVTGDVAVVEQDQIVTFKATPKNGEQFTYAWEFPGGQPAASTLASPQVIYDKAGEYDVRLTVTNEFGLSATAEIAKYVEVTPVTFKAAFSAVEAQDIYFIDDFEEKLDLWEQDTTYTGRPWQTLFNTDTGYELINPKSKNRLYVYNTGDTESNAVMTTADAIEIKPKSVLSFYAIPELVEYTSDVIAIENGDTIKVFSISDWQKSLTDYDKSWQLVTADLSALSGKAVKLGFTFQGTRNYYERISIDEVKVYQTGLADNAAKVYIDDQVHYQNQSVGEGLTYQWTFEGGQPATSTEKDPVVTYNEPGTYAAKLVITGSDAKTETVEKKDFVTVGYKQPVATVYYPEEAFLRRTGGTPFVPGTNKPVTFRVKGTNHPTYYSWEILDADDKVVAQSNDSVITVAFDTIPGRYSSAFYHYRVTVGNPGGEHVITASEQTIKVGSSNSIWNFEVGAAPNSMKVYYMTDENGKKLGNYGGSNNAGVTKWAERFVAPLDTAYVLQTAIDFAKTKIYSRGSKATLYLAYETEDGVPGEPIEGSEVTLNASQLTESSHITRSTAWTQFRYDAEFPILLLPKPWYVVVEGMGTYAEGENDMAIGSEVRTNSTKSTTWMYQNNEWKPVAEPMTLLISPYVGYDQEVLRTLIDEWVKTGIREIGTTGTGREEYYDLNGRRLQEAPQQGVYILRSADGKVKKQAAK
ncbi:MAG: PKD domain-containing protein [Prevotella sp.]|nr:PKD domain-containing protein [Prevotella sp.]